jgi:aerobic carbon-monoxide dehydrogenase small subunit
MKVNFTLNRQSCTVDIPGHWTLLDVLRDQLHMKGTKYGCGEGVCGTCTILIDGQPVRACIVLAANAGGKSILTVEGLEVDGKLDPLQTSFVEHGASQCGFCTPGMMLSAKALLAENPAPTRQEVREALAGNLCRCTGYTKIIDAVVAVATGVSA